MYTLEVVSCRCLVHIYSPHVGILLAPSQLLELSSDYLVMIGADIKLHYHSAELFVCVLLMT